MAKNMIFFIIPILGFLFSFVFFESYADNSDKSHSITVSYVNNTSKAFTIITNGSQNYLTQSYFWSDNNSSRYYLQAYSLDNGPFVAIQNNLNKNFTLQLSANSKHSILFEGKLEFKLTVPYNNKIDFLPASPTSDNWFDAGSTVQIVAPYTIYTNENNTRQQLDGWSIDDSDLYVISREETGNFKSPIIYITSPHKINLDYKTQYYVKVISNFGQTLGTGWYDSGTIFDISVIPGNDVLVKHEFSGWQGQVIGSGDQESANVLSDSPKILVANWFIDYTNFSIITIIAIAISVLLIIYQKKRTSK